MSTIQRNRPRHYKPRKHSKAGPYERRTPSPVPLRASRTVSLPMPPHGVSYEYHVAVFLLDIQTAAMRGGSTSWDDLRRAHQADLLGLALLGDIANADLTDFRETLASPLAAKHLNAVRYHGGDPGQTLAGMTGLNPLHVVAMHGLAEFVKPLVKAGIDLRALTTDGRTALDLATRRGHTAVVEAIQKAKGRG
ncbi:Ankyrin repeat-containing protein [Paraburkholderia phenazinium]|uniref:Ankyrin repeat-containing protein n=1 Tax=Paraburkholderia phenazinium TaxID=60549 RepID=A0A1G7YEU9_9BURK|nr:ankyrin repeat domain-containing protein [Paraburkholderia phenazinium]SDG94865.1 Ankyrin repeat-containing protein [Paraburkholderia phenazinium]